MRSACRIRYCCSSSICLSSKRANVCLSFDASACFSVAGSHRGGDATVRLRVADGLHSDGACLLVADDLDSEGAVMVRVAWAVSNSFPTVEGDCSLDVGE